MVSKNMTLPVTRTDGGHEVTLAASAGFVPKFASSKGLFGSEAFAKQSNLASAAHNITRVS
jgi:hypothetical protein